MGDAISPRRSAGSVAVILLATPLVALASLPAPAQDKPAPDQTYSLWPKWGPFIDIEGTVGTKRNIGEATLFVPVWQDERTMLFGDVRFKVDDQQSWEGNFGLGLRRMLEGGWNVGGYGFYDRRHTPTGNFFNQLTFGAELLGTNFDLRANTYWPIGNTVQQVGQATTGPSTATVITGGALEVFTPATMATMEYALRGFDAEAGVRIPITPAQSPYNLRFYAGGFRFDEPTGTVPIIAGPRLRLEFTDYAVAGLWGGTRFTVGAEWQTDQVRGSQFFAGLRLRVPLQAEPRRASFTMQERRMTDAIVRDVDIVANTQTIEIAPSITEAATTTAGGQAITGISSATTTGAALPGAVTAAGANSIVVLQGTFNTAAAQVSMPNGQTLMGAGNLTVRTASGRTVTAALPGATINGVNPASSTILMNSNNTLSGLTLSTAFSGGSGGRTVLIADTAGGSVITNNMIFVTQSGANGALALAAGANTGGTITGNTITATGSGGATTMTALGINAGGTFTVSGNGISASGGTTNNMVNLANSNIAAGSTGNARGSGNCAGTPASGSIDFTNGTTCP